MTIGPTSTIIVFNVVDNESELPVDVAGVAVVVVVALVVVVVVVTVVVAVVVVVEVVVVPTSVSDAMCDVVAVSPPLAVSLVFLRTLAARPSNAVPRCMLNVETPPK